MTVVRNADRTLVDMGHGVYRRTMVWGEGMLLAEISFDAGGQVPTHDHSYEQLGYCLSGHFELTVGGAVHNIEAGMSWVIPGGTPHAAHALEPSFLIEIWSPPRDDYKD